MTGSGQPETAATPAGADIKLTSTDRPGGPAADQTPAPEDNAVMLDTEQIAVALEALPSWEHESGALLRRVEVAAGSQALVRSVEQIAGEMGHDCKVTVDGDHVELRLGTPSAGGVTELDVDLAARIDQVLSGSQATGTDPAHP